MTTLQRITIVGAGLAGLRTAETLRAAGYDGTLIMLGDEQHRPYNRPPLSKAFLTDELDPDALALPTRDDLQIDLRLGVRATQLRLDERSVMTDTGAVDKLDAVVIATGSRARSVAFPHLNGIRTLRTVADADLLRTDLRRGDPVVVLGAGFIGCEIASSCTTLDVPVTLVDLAPAPMLRLLGPQAGSRLAQLHRDAGVRFKLGVGIEQVTGRGRVEHAVLTDGSTLAADTVVVAVGSTVDTAWLRGSGLTVDDGIVCDSLGRARGGNGHVYAAGDSARWAVGDNAAPAERGEHWTGAAEQGTIVARALLGKTAPPLTAPFVWSDQHGHRLQVIGRPTDGPDVEVHQADEPNRWSMRYLRDGHLVGAVALDQPSVLARARRELATASISGANPSPAGAPA